jgi:hypothetical protein
MLSLNQPIRKDQERLKRYKKTLQTISYTQDRLHKELEPFKQQKEFELKFKNKKDKIINLEKLINELVLNISSNKESLKLNLSLKKKSIDKINLELLKYKNFKPIENPENEIAKAEIRLQQIEIQNSQNEYLIKKYYAKNN